MELVDSHCHLDMNDLETATMLEDAAAQGVRYFLNVSVDLETLPQIIATAQQHQGVFASAGVHPNTPVAENEPSVADLVALAADDKVIAIGETGLDFFRSTGDLDWQFQRFRNHISAAKETGKPLIIHCREAREDVLRVLQEERAQEIGGVMHCFVEDWETAEAAMELGFYISFSGIVTFNSAKILKDVARRLPLERLLVETDSPYLAPVPHRGKTNQPAYVSYVAQHIADLRETALADIAQASTDNFFKLFPHAQAARI